jgi:hypothetical protein
MIKETLTLFLAHQQQTLEHEESLAHNNESLGQTQNEQPSEIIVKSQAEREIHAAQIVQVFYHKRKERIPCLSATLRYRVLPGNNFESPIFSYNYS